MKLSLLRAMHAKYTTLSLLAAVLLLPIPESAYAVSVKLVASESGDLSGFDFYGVNSNTGRVTTLGTTTFLAGMDYRQNGILYGSGRNLYTVNDTTGAVVSVGILPELVVSLAFSQTDRLYGLANSSPTLWEINPSTGAALGGVFINGPTGIRAIDYGPDGRMYTVINALLTKGIYTIDTLTGDATLYRSLSGDLPTLGFDSLDYGQDGMLRAYSNESISNLYQIDPETGVSVLVGPTTTTPPAIEITGLASSPVPIPPALYLFGSGLIGLVGMARRKKA